MKDSRRIFTKEFKKEAVELYLNGDRSMQEVADGLGIKIYHISNWKKEYLADKEKAFPGKGNRKDKDDEIYQLKKEIADIKMENEILKKSIAIFSKHQ